MNKTASGHRLLPWDIARFREDATLPCGDPHPFRGLPATIVEVHAIEPGLEDCRVMIHARASEIGERMSGGVQDWLGEDVVECFPLRIFGAEMRNLEEADRAEIPDPIFALDRASLSRSGEVVS